MQVTLSSISDGIKSTSEENESLRGECIRLKEQLVDTLNRLQKSAEYNEKIVEVRAAENKLCVCLSCWGCALLLVGCWSRARRFAAECLFCFPFLFGTLPLHAPHPTLRFESHAHQLEERSKIEIHKSALLQQQVSPRCCGPLAFRTPRAHSPYSAMFSSG
jgi:hypothetical protein